MYFSEGMNPKYLVPDDDGKKKETETKESPAQG
jgi:hypothetical protein